MVMDVHRPIQEIEQGHVWRIDYMSASRVYHHVNVPIVTKKDKHIRILPLYTRSFKALLIFIHWAWH